MKNTKREKSKSKIANVLPTKIGQTAPKPGTAAQQGLKEELALAFRAGDPPAATGIDDEGFRVRSWQRITCHSHRRETEGGYVLFVESSGIAYLDSVNTNMQMQIVNLTPKWTVLERIEMGRKTSSQRGYLDSVNTNMQMQIVNLTPE
ncbi:hypothetical protein SDJN03_03130, partial [Cucurbita argyrosperma subsp. sororia]